MAKEEKPKTKRPTALKRDIRNEKHRLINKSFKSNVRTTMRAFDEALKSKDSSQIQKALSSVYSVMDKGVKQGVFKPNKAARIKGRVTLKTTAAN